MLIIEYQKHLFISGSVEVSDALIQTVPSLTAVQSMDLSYAALC